MNVNRPTVRIRHLLGGWHTLHALSAMGDAHPPKVLVIDDDPNVREVVSYLLHSFGYDSQTAADGATGVTRFAEGGWDVVITDLAMPEMNGWEVVEAIRQRSSSTPIILITGLASPAVMRRAAERGLAVVTKPFRSETLMAAVAKALRARRSHPTPSSQG